VDIIGQIAVPKFTKSYNDSLLKRDVSTEFRISKTPLEPDLLEHERVTVKDSKAGEDAGEGLFAKVQFATDDLVAIYNGVRTRPDLHEDWSDYKVHFSSEFDIDIPDDMRRTDEYCTTLAHKANHSFAPNTKWGRIDHPM